jgi:hypothetical protein
LTFVGSASIPPHGEAKWRLALCGPPYRNEQPPALGVPQMATLLASHLRTGRSLQPAMTTFPWTVARAWLQLFSYDMWSVLGFRRTYDRLRRTCVRTGAQREDRIRHVCAAVDEACVWYWKRVFCLQRSVVTAKMLRRVGVHAELVIGVRPIPLESHAWVEVDGTVVNDRPQYQRAFRVLHRT